MTKSKASLLLLLGSLCLILVVVGDQIPPQKYCGKTWDKIEKFSIPPPDDRFTLKQVHTYIRHGDRLPADSGNSPSYGSCWPGDNAVWDCTLNYDQIPDTNPSRYEVITPRLYRKIYDAGSPFPSTVYPGNCQMGQLTQVGYAQEVENGLVLREAYVNRIPLLSNELDNSEIFVRSDDQPRTVQSAHGLLLGLFPPTDYNTTIDSQIVDIHTMDYQVDATALNLNICPRLLEILNETAQQPSYIEHINNITTPLLNDLAAAFGISPASINEEYAWDCLNTHICHNLSIPGDVTLDLYDRLYTEQVWEFGTLLNYPNTTYNSQLSIGFYLAEFYAALSSFLSVGQGPKFYLWSGHDVTLYAVMMAMDFFDNEWPAYASMINFEILQKIENQEYHVRIIYNGKEMTLPACNNKTYCPIDTFLSFLASLLPVDPAVSCQPTSPTTLYHPLFNIPKPHVKSVLRQLRRQVALSQRQKS